MSDPRRPRVDIGAFTLLYLVLVVYGVVIPGGAAFVLFNATESGRLDPIVAALILVGGLVILALSTAAVLAVRLASPIRDIARHLQAIGRGEPVEPIETRRNDEIGQLQRALNQMSAQLAVAHAARVDRQYLQDVLDSMPDCLVVLDKNGVVSVENRAFQHLLGYTEQGGTGLSLERLVGARRPAWFQALLDEQPVVHEEVVFRTREGREIELTTSGGPLRDDTGQLRGVVLVARDLRMLRRLTRELRTTSERLASSERFFQDLFDAMDDPITVLSPDYEVMQANRAARDLFGSDVLGRRCYRAFRMRDRACEDCPVRGAYDSGESATVEHRVFGNAVTRISAYPLLGRGGKVQAVINVKRDVTKERALDDLKAGFLAAVSHELRTPLTSIIGFNKLNLRRLMRHVRPALAGASDQVREQLDRTVSDMEVTIKEGERLGRLVNDVLDLSKLEAGKLKVEMTEVAVAPLVESALAATSSLWQAKTLDVTAEVPSDCPPAWGDADRLSQVLVNLLSNAIKFTPAGSIAVRVQYDDTDLRFSVRDSGPGIAPDEAQHVFEKFHQTAGTEHAGPQAGTGLGLPICRELVRLHEGRIWVESAPGAGATFQFTLLRADRLDELERSARHASSFSTF